LRQIREKVDLALANFGPADYYAIEMPWVGFNANVAIKLGQVRGMIIGEILCLNPKAKIVDITPMQIRTFLNIESKCKKEVMQEEINKMFEGRLTEVIKLGKNQDEIDSIGVAIAAYNKLMINNLSIRSNENICIN
jgi:Holliday junction resolvasome RuvABC endonuclease subunit